MGNEDAARKFAATLPVGPASIGPVQFAGSDPVLDGWAVNYKCEEPRMCVDAVFFGGGHARIDVAFDGAAEDVILSAHDAIHAVLGGGDYGL